MKFIACVSRALDNYYACGDNAFNHNQWSIITEALPITNRITFMAAKRKVAKKSAKKAGKKSAKKAVKKAAKKKSSKKKKK